MFSSKKETTILAFSLTVLFLAILNRPSLENSLYAHALSLNDNSRGLIQAPLLGQTVNPTSNQMPLILIQSTPFQPSSKLLKDKYDGAEILITNKSPHNIELLNIQLTNSLTGEEAYKASHRNLFSWYSFLGVSSFVTNTTLREVENKTAYVESERYVSFHPNTGVLPGQTIQTVLLVQKKKPLIVTIHFQDSVTGKHYKTVYESPPFP